MSARAPFWSDGFDVDLLTLFPNLEEALGETRSIELWTYGGQSGGRLNHPSVWHSRCGMLAFALFEEPEKPRSGEFARIGGYATDAPIVRCTWLELLRDQWVHRYAVQFLPSGAVIYDFQRKAFDALLYHVRGWTPGPGWSAEMAHESAWNGLRAMNARFARIAGVQLRGREVLRPPLPGYASSPSAKQVDA